MAKISTYPISSTPTLSDKLLGTDPNDLNLTKNYTISEILALGGGSAPAYKVYTALVSQTTVTLSPYNEPPDTTLVVGKEYVITCLNGGDDFSNVGYLENNIPFIAIGTTPLVWNYTNVIDVEASQATVTVLENTIGPINVYTEFFGGCYEIPFYYTYFEKIGEFLSDKTYLAQDALERVDDDKIRITTSILNKSIEIRVYN